MESVIAWSAGQIGGVMGDTSECRTSEEYSFEESYSLESLKAGVCYQFFCETIIREQIKMALHQEVQKLPPREYLVIKMYFGIGCEKMSYRKISDIMKWSPSYVYQLCDKAKRRLKHNRELKYWMRLV